MNKKDLKKLKIPDKPGVYFFVNNKSSARQDLAERILYIGKATSLSDRVKSYFGKDLINTRGPAILDMVTQADIMEWQETDSVLEALILEANLIKKYQPKYNTKEKDNKSFNYVCITNEKLPKVLIMRGRNINFAQKSFFSGPRTRGTGAVPDHSKNLFLSEIFGPFPNGSQLKEAMKIVRRIFPFIDNDSIKKNNREFYKQLSLTPESILEYKNNIKNIKLFFDGKKKSILNNLKKDMNAFSKSKNFENAAKVRNQIFALNHINDVALIKEENIFENTPHFRVEAYDIAHMSGKDMVGVMTVIEDGEVKKSDYKKFIIKTQSRANDTGALEEVLSRRLRHTEWGFPNIIVVDGGKAQINIAKKVLERIKKTSPNVLFARFSDERDGSGARPSQKEHLASFSHTKIVSVLKDERHKAKAIIGDEGIIKKYQKEILLANSESHRFAINFHKNRRNKNFLI